MAPCAFTKFLERSFSTPKPSSSSNSRAAGARAIWFVWTADFGMEMVCIPGGLSHAQCETPPHVFTNINSPPPLKHVVPMIDGCLRMVRKGQADRQHGKIIMDCEVLQQIQRCMQLQICVTGHEDIAPEAIRELGSEGHCFGIQQTQHLRGDPGRLRSSSHGSCVPRRTCGFRCSAHIPRWCADAFLGHRPVDVCGSILNDSYLDRASVRSPDVLCAYGPLAPDGWIPEYLRRASGSPHDDCTTSNVLMRRVFGDCFSYFTVISRHDEARLFNAAVSR